MRTLGPIAAHVAGRAHTVCYLLQLDLRDGTTIALTDHDAAIAYDLGDGVQTFVPGVDISDVALVAGFETSNFEASGPIDATFTRIQVLGGRYRNATARLALLEWSNLDHAMILRGTVGECRVEGARWVFEVRNAADAFNQSQGSVLSPYCRTWFGSPQCKVVRAAYAATVTAVPSLLTFKVDVVQPANFFAYGNAAFLTGELAGTDEAKILTFAADGTVELFEPMFQQPEVGDTLNLYRGCSKMLKADDATIPTCLSYDNVINFRGEPEVPGGRAYMRVSAPGKSYA